MTDTSHAESVRRAAGLVAGAYAILLVTGAGMGVDSGLPDFRGRAGFWNAYPELGRQGLDFADIASPDAFRRHPRLAWGFYGHRLNLYRATPPHAGHSILRRWMDASLLGGAVFTSNVDGHSQQAGLADARVLECHGSINHLQCLDGCHDDVWPADGVALEIDTQNCLARGELPRCPRCAAVARPNVYMFNDYDWLDARRREQAQAVENWLQHVERLVVIEIGAGTAIPTAREFTHRMAFEFDAPVIRVNPHESAIYGNDRHVSLAMGGLEAVQRIDAALSS